MAEDSDLERTEEPSHRRRQQAIDEGRVVRSNELTTAALLFGSAATVNMVGPALASRVVELFAGGLRAVGTTHGGTEGAIALLRTTGMGGLFIAALLAAGTAVCTLAVGVLQGQGVLALKPIAPDWKRVNPLDNAKRMLGTQSIAELLKALVKVLLVGWAVWHMLGTAWPELMELASRDPATLLDTLRRLTVSLLTTAGVAYTVLAAADWGWQKWQYERNLRMTKEELKQEAKQSDGDPTLRGRMRSLARARIRRQMFKDVPRADLVLVNPTHIAIALQYDPVKAPAPVVLAMGERKIAERIKAIALASGVPVIQNKPLARALLKSARVGLMIPAELYAAVAEVLAFVIRQRARHGRAVPASRALPSRALTGAAE